jgi:2-keto-4-pentenoate hydratase/2-oxohepta-3-ene-1,7-dioic acid hydratase in catechol pathway
VHWTLLGHLPYPAGYSAAATWGSKLLCTGGENGSEIFSRVLQIEVDSRGKLTIDDLPPLPQPLALARSAVTADTLFVTGGLHDSGAEIKDDGPVFLALPLRGSHQWTALPAAWKHTLVLPEVAACGDTLLVAGGLQANASVPSKPIYVADAWSYKPSKKQWSQLPSLPHPVTGGAAVCSAPGHWIVLGGDDGALAAQGAALRDHHPGFPKHVFAFDPKDRTWNDANSVPVSLLGSGGTLWNGLIVLPGGEDRPAHRSNRVLAVPVSTFAICRINRSIEKDECMKLVRYGNAGEEKPGLLDLSANIRDLSGIVPDLSGAALSSASLRRIASLAPQTLPRVSGSPRLGPCVAQPGKFICIGLNYADHAAESGMALPSEPVVFMKASSSISGPDDNIELPRNSTKTDWEVELGVVIGTRAKYVEMDRALDHVAGYCVVNDLSERAFQLEGTGQWVKGKSADTFGPIGPWLVTAEEVRDPQDLHLWLEVNGQRFQNGSTKTMVFGVAYLISYLSRFMTLHPGDIISTGTPPGVALGMAVPRYLQAGDEVRLGIDGLGEQRQRVVAPV